jgi:NACHT domain/Tetratricopeptide repeat
MTSLNRGANSLFNACMGERRVLVIGSQCAGLAYGHLSFLPRRAEELYEVLTDPRIGACKPALPESGLLLDPTLADMAGAIRRAVARASADRATLLMAFIGHAVHEDEDLYLLPIDGEEHPDTFSAYLVGRVLAGLLHRFSSLDGLLVLLDACYAGEAITSAPTGLWRHVAEGRLRFEVLTAVNDRPAANGCFSRAMIEMLRRGDEHHLLEHLDANYLQPRIKTQWCPKQQPPVLAVLHAGANDPGLWLGRNVALDRRRPLAGTPAAVLAERLTRWLHPSPQLAELVFRSQVQRCTALVGPSGTGKSTLVAALARPEACEGYVPERLVHAVAFAALAPSPAGLATALAEQLRRLPGFTEAEAAYQHSGPEEWWKTLDAFEQLVIGPLRQMGDQVAVVRIAIDGLDQLSDALRETMLEVFDRLLDIETPRVHLILTSRDNAYLPRGTYGLATAGAEAEDVEGYLIRRQVPERIRAMSTALIEGNWLIAGLIADLADAGVLDPDQPFADLGELYEHVLDRLTKGSPDAEMTAVLTVLAVTEPGPAMPIRLLAVACGQMGGSEEPARVRDVLVQLQALVVRADPGTDDEGVGLFHGTLMQHLRGRAFLDLDLRAGHKAVAAAIAQLAPAEHHDPADALHRYAGSFEAEHWWQIGDRAAALKALTLRTSPRPEENVRTWRRWLRRALAELGTDHPDTLAIRANIALWTGRVGDAAGALRLYRELLPDVERVLGPDHPDALAARTNMAFWTERT